MLFLVLRLFSPSIRILTDVHPLTENPCLRLMPKELPHKQTNDTTNNFTTTNKSLWPVLRFSKRVHVFMFRDTSVRMLMVKQLIGNHLTLSEKQQKSLKIIDIHSATIDTGVCEHNANLKIIKKYCIILC